MPSSRPTADDLLAVVREYLQKDLSPLVPEYHRFQLRIVDRLLATVLREHQLGAVADQAESARIAELLQTGADGESDDPAGSLAELNRRLALSLREGTLRHDDSRVLTHLRATLEASLRINNPKWLAPTGALVPHTETEKPQSS